ncbi:DUF4384 domain-containing protein [Gemmata sp. JC673]|uniref:DUF4384 domain-containing protein n=1 Tax=Gemmata algarum TaxID=2975278 RepID=A0ABU5F2D5_9BACT|nr:hypothetical protein [Gemmata algarum]MDY3560024.1 DUF4384 domain-containing protein [Gemmata algarum]
MRSIAGAVALALLASAGVRATEPLDHRGRGDLAIKARDILKRHCAECHTGSTDPGKSRTNLLDHAQVAGEKKKPIPLAAAGERSLLLELLADGSMPPGNRPAPTPAEVAVLKKWIDAKAPGYPLAFDEDYILGTIADELKNKPDLSKTKQYVSFAHLVRDGEPHPDLGAAERNLRIALALSSSARTGAALEPVDEAGTVFRFDLVEQQWRGGYVFELMEGRKPTRNADPTHLDVLIERENPYATALRPNELPAARLKELLGLRVAVAAVPYLRGDWLSSSLLAPAWAPKAVFGWGPRSPLAADLFALSALQRLNPTDVAPGGPVARPFAGLKPVSVPSAGPGRMPIPPLSAWYAGDVVPRESPLKLKVDLIVGAKPVTQVKVDEPFTLEVWCEQKVYFTLLMVQADGEVRVQEVLGGNVLKPGQAQRLLQPNGKSFVIGGINGGGKTAVEHFVLFVSETELPAPTIVRSKHGSRYVWRFSMEPTERFPFEPNKVVRKVVPIHVARE